MSRKKQIWYFEGSPAASVAKPLGRQYALRALDILEMSVRDRELDSELFKLFLEARIYQLTAKRP